ncbi:MAG: hypothetical protein IH991_00655 [Planctomycetes bacterium]|nr:hypothetical protein [Planctomycetota bacterium]
MIIVEQNPFLSEFLLQDLVFGAEILDGLLLLTINPTGECEQQDLPRLKDVVHGSWILDA